MLLDKAGAPTAAVQSCAAAPVFVIFSVPTTAFAAIALLPRAAQFVEQRFSGLATLVTKPNAKKPIQNAAGMIFDFASSIYLPFRFSSGVEFSEEWFDAKRQTCACKWRQACFVDARPPALLVAGLT